MSRNRIRCKPRRLAYLCRPEGTAPLSQALQFQSDFRWAARCLPKMTRKEALCCFRCNVIVGAEESSVRIVQSRCSVLPISRIHDQKTESTISRPVEIPGGERRRRVLSSQRIGAKQPEKWLPCRQWPRRSRKYLVHLSAQPRVENPLTLG